MVDAAAKKYERGEPAGAEANMVGSSVESDGVRLAILHCDLDM